MEKFVGVKEMTGLSKSGLPSCAQYPALLIPIPMFCDIFLFLRALIDEGTGVEKSDD